MCQYIIRIGTLIKERKLKRSRGRPRKFDEDTALEAARDVFWANGFSATSLDDLADAMEMNRPSIYRAFGDKETLYRSALAQFSSQMKSAMQETLFAESDLRKGLQGFYQIALEIYLSGSQSKGCLVMSTAVSVAVCHAEIREDLLSIIKIIDKGFEQRLQFAIDEGQLPQDFDATARAAIAQSILHSLSLRARAGESRRSLNRLLKAGVETVVS
ncbi:MAG TPA: TetR/AcrR family transcriptional regulator [Gammaproteobacteria bacterium]|nr:TetR/AcrR family transcriptional regulator [Gammaproteobacteria bacterium]HIM04389.1 TetR/AcrR family transcriptional regulator [Gammaproteobacteria bacterium]